MKRALELIRLRLSRTWLLMLIISVSATTFAGLWWQFDVMGISDDERGAYDDGLMAFTLPKRAVLQFVQEKFGLGKLVKSEDVMVVALDDFTMTEISQSEVLRTRYGQSVPYNRVIWADLITYLSQAGAKGIVFDMVMNEPSGDQPDLAIGGAVDEAKVPVIFGFNNSVTAPPIPRADGTSPKPIGKMPVLTKETPEGEFPEEPTPEEQAEIDKKSAENRLVWASKAYTIPLTFSGLEVPTFPEVTDRTDEGTTRTLKPVPMAVIPPLLEAANGFGSVTSEEDEDGKLRRTAFAYSDGTNVYPTLALAAVTAIEGAQEVRIEPGVLTIGTRKVRINQDGTAELHYGGRLGDRFKMISLVGVLRRYDQCTGEKRSDDCLNGIEADPQGRLFKNKIVLVGGVAVGSGDSKATPLEQATPGLVKQAATIDNLIKDQFIIAAPFWVSLVFALIVALFSVSLVMVVRNTFVDIGWPVLLYVGFFTITGSFLVATRIHVLSALPGLAGTVASILATTWERLFAAKERERMKELFQNYMESDLVEMMVEQKQLPNLEGENLEVTAFFSDIKGFSTFSEKLKAEPKKLIRVMNRYLSIVTPQLTGEGACIDKYIGDAVVALFGAPVSHADHALRACRGALAVQKAIGELREEFRKEGLPDVYTRIGINTGTMMVGNIGSAQLLDYTAIGDEMNLAARLEGANKNYGTLIMMGPNTYAAVKDHVDARELDHIRVAGKSNAATVYELLGMKGQAAPEKMQLVALYSEALIAYRARDFAAAKAKVGEALLLDAGDGPSRRLMTLCSEFEIHPPPESWDAVSTLEK